MFAHFFKNNPIKEMELYFCISNTLKNTDNYVRLHFHIYLYKLAHYF